MPEIMKCFVMHGIGKVGATDKPVPRPGPGDAVIRTTAALICTSDTHTVAGAIGQRRDLTLGHESVSVVHELGELAAASGLFEVGRCRGQRAHSVLCVRQLPAWLNVGYHGDGDSVPIPRADWGVGMGDKAFRTTLCPGGSERMGRLMRLIELGRVDPRDLTMHRFPFADIGKAFGMMQTKADGMIKPLISFA